MHHEELALRSPVVIGLLCLLGPVLNVGCVSMATSGLADNLSTAILNQNDPETVRVGAPAYLLLVDGLIAEAPEDRDLLIAGAKLYGTYAAVFVEDPERARRLADKARDYARRALCQRYPEICDRETGSYDDFVAAADDIAPGDLPALYVYGAAWATWLQVNSDDWEAVADLPKIEVVMERVIAMDEGFERGQAHLYLGVIRSQIPSSLGGDPESGRVHFEQAIALSRGRNLIAKVEFARHYARLTFDRTLHDRLLQEVLDADPVEPGLTLSNMIARQQATDLLAESEDYFGE
jgi:hypothetical protein